MMNLHSRIPLREIKDPDRFDFLKGCHPEIKRVDEVHPSEDNDGHYLFLVWLKDANKTEEIKKQITKNFKSADLDREWRKRKGGRK